jgi:signal transduction histidine kinase
VARRRLSAVARAAVAGVAVGVLVVTAAVAGSRGDLPYETTYGDASAWFALLEILAGGALTVAALLLLAERATAVAGCLATAASATWLAPAWVGWEDGPAVARSLAAAAAPLLPALLFALVTQVPPRLHGRGGATVAAVATLAIGVTAAASIALALVRDPLRDRYCWSDCTVNAFLAHDDARLAHRLWTVVLALGVASGGLAAVTGGVRLGLARGVTRRSSGPALAGAALAGAALAAYALALQLEPREAPHRPLYAWLFAARALALVALGAGLAWLAVRPRIVRGLVTRFATDLERSGAEGGLGKVLGRAVGDPGLRLGYPVGPGDRVVDADGSPLVLDRNRRVTEIVDGEGEGALALVESPSTSAEALERELGPAAYLALGNERLRALAIARLDDAVQSRARIVDTADAARRRMERDLHDGAQQRLLALTYDLRVALTIAEAAGNEQAAEPLRSALARAVTASRELRDVAHGIFPAELATSGLEAALQSLADVRPLHLAPDLPSDRRYPPETEAAAYAVVVEALEANAGPVSVAWSEDDGMLLLVVDGVDDWGERLVHVEDRVLAAGGTLAVAGKTARAALPFSPA